MVVVAIVVVILVRVCAGAAVVLCRNARGPSAGAVITITTSVGRAT